MFLRGKEVTKSKIMDSMLSSETELILMDSKTADIIDDILAELQRADIKHANDPMTHMRVGFKTLECEVKELEREVERSTYSVPRPDLMRNEAVQTGAMAIKFIRDICDRPVDGDDAHYSHGAYKLGANDEFNNCS